MSARKAIRLAAFLCCGQPTQDSRALREPRNKLDPGGGEGGRDALTCSDFLERELRVLVDVLAELTQEVVIFKDQFVDDHIFVKITPRRLE